MHKSFWDYILVFQGRTKDKWESINNYCFAFICNIMTKFHNNFKYSPKDWEAFGDFRL